MEPRDLPTSVPALARRREDGQGNPSLPLSLTHSVPGARAACLLCLYTRRRPRETESGRGGKWMGVAFPSLHCAPLAVSGGGGVAWAVEGRS